jgi:DNA-binding CsgD family transcriptional regulator
MLTDDYFAGTRLYHKALSKFIVPLEKYLGVNQAMYVNINKDGNCFATCTNVKIVEDHLERKGYLHNTSHVSPENMHSGFAFEAACQNENYRNINLYTYITKFNWHNSFAYAEKDNLGGYFFFSLSTNKDNFAISNRVVNESIIIRKMLRDINKKMIILFGKEIEDLRMSFADLSGENFYKNKGRVYNEQTELDQKRKIKLLQELGILSKDSSSESLFNVKLSPQEINCLRLYTSNQNIKKVARDLNLAATTVTSYIENIKNKLRCNNKSDLFEKAEILESIGSIYL